MLNTIQITRKEDHIITQLKNKLGFSSKKAVIMAGLEALVAEHERQKRVERLKKASLAVRKESQKINEELMSGSVFGGGGP